MLNRPAVYARLQAATQRSPITVLLGPRQCGKTTLAKQLAQMEEHTWFDLESIGDQRRLHNPELALGGFSGLVILDEILVVPELFSVLRRLLDRPGQTTRFLILSSASPDAIRLASETCLDRLEFIELSGFDLSETGSDVLTLLWERGGFPGSFLAESHQHSWVWREDYIRTYLERDLPQLGFRFPASAMRRFWTMLAHYQGRTWNASELARSMGLSDKTVRSYRDILTKTRMVHQLQPWEESLGKRLVKSPKVYFRDSGLMHHLLEIKNPIHLMAHPNVAASWKGFAIEQILRAYNPPQPYFWSTYSGAGLDLFFIREGSRLGFEFPFNEAPKVTASMRQAKSDLRLDQLWVIHPGYHRQSLEPGIIDLPLVCLHSK